MYIYKITNKINGTYYIGCTERLPYIRFREHIKESNTSNYYIHRSIKKYGSFNFTYKIIDAASTIDELHDLEKYYIQVFESNIYKFPDGKGMNMTDGGEGFTGRTHTEETKKLIGEKGKGNQYCVGYKHTNATKRNMSRGQRGCKKPPRTKTHREKLRQANLGKKLSEEHKKKLSKAHTGKKGIGIIKVAQYTLDNEFIREFESIKEAAELTSANASHISSVCKGKRKQTGGFVWKYII